MIGLKRKQVGKEKFKQWNVITDIEYYDFQLEKKAKEKWLKWKKNDEEKKRRTKWISLLTKEKYSTLVTIQKPMRNKHMLDGNIEKFFNQSRVSKLFYSVEPNTKKKGYHIHLMFDAFKCTKEILAWNLDINPSDIPYYESINSKSAVSGYVTKHMKADQIHYNFYSK
jgi:hypothetical protein